MWSKHQLLYTITSPCLTTGILEINTLRNEFDALQEISETPTPNNEYENFVNAHLAKCIPTNKRAKLRVPQETLPVRKKCADMRTTSKCNRKNPTNINAT